MTGDVLGAANELAVAAALVVLSAADRASRQESVRECAISRTDSCRLARTS